MCVCVCVYLSSYNSRIWAVLVCVCVCVYMILYLPSCNRFRPMLVCVCECMWGVDVCMSERERERAVALTFLMVRVGHQKLC